MSNQCLNTRLLKSRGKPYRGATLVEALIVVAIIGLLVSLLLPAVQASRESARRTVCSGKMRQVGLALFGFESARSRFPSGNEVEREGVVGGCPRPEDDLPRTKPWQLARAPWTVQILQFMEETTLFNRFDMEMPFMSDLTDQATKAETPNLSFQLSVVTAFQCPSDPNSKGHRPNNCYYGVIGDGLGEFIEAGEWPNCSSRESRRRLDNDGMLFLNSRVTKVPSGRSKTYLLGEQRRQLPEQTWASAAYVSKEHGALRNLSSTLLPINKWPFTPPSQVVLVRGTPVVDLGFDYDQQLIYLEQSFGSYHDGGCFFAMVDGSVRFESDGIDMSVYRAKANRHGP